jgi:hypothetical protein
MSRTLVIIGLAIAVVGLLWPWTTRLGLGRLPGDIFIQREGFTFYAPITSGIPGEPPPVAHPVAVFAITTTRALRRMGPRLLPAQPASAR